MIISNMSKSINIIRNSMSISTLLVAFLFVLVLIFSCKKEINNVHISIIQLDTTINVRDTLNVRYNVSGENIDSVCLLVDSEIYATQISHESNILFIPDNSGTYSMKVVAYHRSGLSKKSGTIIVKVNKLSSPEIWFSIKRIDGLNSYFVGEELLVTVKKKTGTWFAGTFKEITFYLNGENLGTVSSEPFTFETSTILSSENMVSVEITDNNHHLYIIESTIKVPVNEPPEIELMVWLHPDYTTGYYSSTDSIVLDIKGSDDVKVEYVDYYLDNQYVSTDTVNSYWFFGRWFTIDYLSPGTHDVYCVAYDDRNDSTISNHIELVVSKSIDIDSEIVDTEYTENEEHVFAISASKLIIINPENEEITEIVNLPFSDAVTIDYSEESQKLYIGFRDGQLVNFNSNSGDFNTLTTTMFSDIGDLQVDESIETLLLISDQKVVALNLSTFDTIQASVNLEQGASLAYNRTDNTIIAGGKPDSYTNYFYKLFLVDGSILFDSRKSLGGYAKKILLNQGRQEFVIQRHNSAHYNGYKVYDEVNFGEEIGGFEIQKGNISSFSVDGNKFYANESWNKELSVFDAQNFSQLGLFPIPLKVYDAVVHIIPVVDNSKAVLITRNSSSGDIRIIFLRF